MVTYCVFSDTHIHTRTRQSLKLDIEGDLANGFARVLIGLSLGKVRPVEDRLDTREEYASVQQLSGIVEDLALPLWFLGPDCSGKHELPR